MTMWTGMWLVLSAGYKETSSVMELSPRPLRIPHRPNGKQTRTGQTSLSEDYNYGNQEINRFALGRTSGDGLCRGFLPRTLPSCASNEPGHARTGPREPAAFACREGDPGHPPWPVTRRQSSNRRLHRQRCERESDLRCPENCA